MRKDTIADRKPDEASHAGVQEVLQALIAREWHLRARISDARIAVQGSASETKIAPDSSVVTPLGAHSLLALCPQMWYCQGLTLLRGMPHHHT